MVLWLEIRKEALLEGWIADKHIMKYYWTIIFDFPFHFEIVFEDTLGGRMGGTICFQKKKLNIYDLKFGE